MMLLLLLYYIYLLNTVMAWLMCFVQSEPFHRPVDCALFSRYTDFVYNPMDFTTLERVSHRTLRFDIVNQSRTFVH